MVSVMPILGRCKLTWALHDSWCPFWLCRLCMELLLHGSAVRLPVLCLVLALLPAGAVSVKPPRQPAALPLPGLAICCIAQTMLHILISLHMSLQL